MSEIEFRVCGVCGLPKAVTDYYKSVSGLCKECHKAAVRRRYRDAGGRPGYEREREQLQERKDAKRGYLKTYRAKNPEKNKARQRLSYAVRTGKIVRKPCEVCGTTDRVQAHHHDYSKPLDVRWLCFQHHREEEHEQTVRSEHLKSAT